MGREKQARKAEGDQYASNSPAARKARHAAHPKQGDHMHQEGLGHQEGLQSPLQEVRCAICHVSLSCIPAGIVRVEDSESTLYASIDLVCDKIDRKMIKVGCAMRFWCTQRP